MPRVSTQQTRPARGTAGCATGTIRSPAPTTQTWGGSPPRVPVTRSPHPHTHPTLGSAEKGQAQLRVPGALTHRPRSLRAAQGRNAGRALGLGSDPCWTLPTSAASDEPLNVPKPDETTGLQGHGGIPGEEADFTLSRHE